MQINIDAEFERVKLLKYNDLWNLINAGPFQEIPACSYSQCEGREFDPPPHKIAGRDAHRNPMSSDAIFHRQGLHYRKQGAAWHSPVAIGYTTGRAAR
ncbi:hypothetical protein [Paraburkholderia youngii]|uniref:hypothetical protein n=1 Tax=Paraburkholderia youngii TaxID=2782701 RepID=UPI003D240E2F